MCWCFCVFSLLLPLFQGRFEPILARPFLLFKPYLALSLRCDKDAYISFLIFSYDPNLQGCEEFCAFIAILRGFFKVLLLVKFSGGNLHIVG